MFTCIFFSIIFFGVSVTLHLFKKSGLSVTSSELGTSIQFTEYDRKTRFESVLIHPRDWNDPEIPIAKGDEVTVRAFGSVHIAAGLFHKSLKRQYDYRDANETNNKINSRSVRALNSNQVDNSLLTVPWSGPVGLDATVVRAQNVKNTQDEEAKNRILPDEWMGRLIAAVVPRDRCPIKGETGANFQLEPYRKNLKFTAQMAGVLCFVVNDHRSDDTKLNQLFWDDNLGFYSANIKVETK